MRRGRPKPGSHLQVAQVEHSIGAGIIGTAVMTGYQLALARAGGRSVHQRVPRTWAEAPAPARAAKRLAEAVGDGSWLTRRQAPLTASVVHWGYGVGWGTLYGTVVGRRQRQGVAGAVALGLGLWALSYAALVPAGIYEPPWRYSATEFAIDLSYHLVYAAAVAGALALLDR